MPRFEDRHVDRAGRFSLGYDGGARQHYLSIPVANRLATYDEYYRLTPGQFDAFAADPSAALGFADACRRRGHDELLILPPGTDRGSAV